MGRHVKKLEVIGTVIIDVENFSWICGEVSMINVSIAGIESAQGAEASKLLPLFVSQISLQLFSFSLLRLKFLPLFLTLLQIVSV